jgi:hypothetical protein
MSTTETAYGVLLECGTTKDFTGLATTPPGSCITQPDFHGGVKDPRVSGAAMRAGKIQAEL